MSVNHEVVLELALDHMNLLKENGNLKYLIERVLVFTTCGYEKRESADVKKRLWQEMRDAINNSSNNTINNNGEEK